MVQPGLNAVPRAGAGPGQFTFLSFSLRTQLLGCCKVCLFVVTAEPTCCQAQRARPISGTSVATCADVDRH